MGIDETQPSLTKNAVGTFLIWCGAVTVLSSLTIGMYNFGPTRLTIGPLVVGVAGVVIGLFLSIDRLTQRMSQRRGQYLGLTAAYSAVVIAIAGGTQYLIATNPIAIDLTAQSVHTLSEQSDKVLAQLESPVRITAFIEKSDPVYGLFERYQAIYQRASTKVEFRAFSPTHDVEEVRRYEMNKDRPPFVAEAYWDDPEKKKVALFRVDMKARNHEEVITNAISSASLRRRDLIVMLTGHGEADPKDEGVKGYSEAALDLANEGYDVIPLNLVVARKLPDDARAVIIPGLKSPLLDPERRELERYMKNGGSLFLMVEPGADHQLDGLLGGFGVQLNNDVVLDLSQWGRMYGERTAIAVDFGEHPITQKFKNTMTIFPESRSVSVNTGTQATVTELMKTGEVAWGETDFEGLAQGEAEWDAGEARGPVTLAVAAIAPLNPGDDKSVSRLVITGDGDFAANEMRKRGGANRDFFLNSVAWLASADERIAVRPRTRGGNLITLTPAQREGIAFFALDLLPTLLLALGLGIYFARRSR